MTNIHDAIRQSITTSSIIHMTGTLEDAAELAGLCEDWVDANGIREYWGEDDGGEWQVHLKVRAYAVVGPDAIYAVAVTPWDAYQKFIREVQPDGHIPRVDDLMDAPRNTSDALYIAPITTALVDKVANEGGAITWDEDEDGTLVPAAY